jgi:hypothetical protein
MMDIHDGGAGHARCTGRQLMHHVLFALFDDANSAASARSALEILGSPRARCELTVYHAPPGNDERPMPETDGWRVLVRGLAIGPIAGAALILLVFRPLGVLHVGPFAALAFGLFLGVIAGAWASIYVHDTPDPTFEKLMHEMRRKPDGTLVTVEAPSLTMAETAEQIARAYGAHVEHRHWLPT